MAGPAWGLAQVGRGHLDACAGAAGTRQAVRVLFKDMWLVQGVVLSCVLVVMCADTPPVSAATAHQVAYGVACLHHLSIRIPTSYGRSKLAYHWSLLSSSLKPLCYVDSRKTHHGGTQIT